jgi:putative transposase
MKYYKRVRMMFQDEAIFGRIGKLYKCWAFKGYRPTVLHQKIREYQHLFGAVDPLSGDSCFRIYSHCDTVTMNHYLSELSKDFKDDYILLICDNAGWHISKDLVIPDNIEIIHIPPYTPEMNPVEQIWDEMREKHFANAFFDSLKQVVDTLCYAVQSLLHDTIFSITYRDWMCQQLM